MAARMTPLRKMFLLRHLKSSRDDPGLDDFDRPLAERGRHDGLAMGLYLARSHIRPGRALVSTSLRTRATWDLISAALEGVPVDFEEDVYLASKGTLLHRLRDLPDELASVMIIGHNPGLEHLAAFLAAGHGEALAVRRMSEKFPTGALAELSFLGAGWRALEGGACRLESFIRPRGLS